MLLRGLAHGPHHGLAAEPAGGGCKGAPGWYPPTAARGEPMAVSRKGGCVAWTLTSGNGSQV